MNLYTYEEAALRTARDADGSLPPLWYLALGLTGEAGEVADLVKKFERHAKPFDRARIIDELGDVLWYLAVMARASGTTLLEVAQHNVAKLERRYPSGFAPRGGGAAADRAAWESAVQVIPYVPLGESPAGEATCAVAIHPEHPTVRVQANTAATFGENRRAALDKLWAMVGTK